MARFSPKFLLLRDTLSVYDGRAGADQERMILPAGSLVQEIKGGCDPASDQLLLECLDCLPEGATANATGVSAFGSAPLDDLLELSAFSAELLLAEKKFKMRLIVSRDENWLEEATHMFEDTDVLVTVGPIQFLGVIHFAGELDESDGRPGRWFVVELKPSVDVEEVVRDCRKRDGYPDFFCESGKGIQVYVTISALRLAEPVLKESFKGRPAGKKRFSTRTVKSRKMEVEKTTKAALLKTVEANKGVPLDWIGTSTSQQQHEENGGNSPRYEVDERVVWFRSEGSAARGTVRFVGRTSSSDKREKIAVEFDEKVGEEGYIGMTNGFGQFAIRNGYGRLLDPGEVMREVDFGYDQQTDAATSKSNTVKASTVPSEKKATKEADVKSEQSMATTLKCGSRAVWFKSAGDVVRGKIVFLGKVGKGKKAEEKIGLCLDEAKGPEGFTGTYHGKDLLTCRPGYGVVTDMDSVMSEKEYDITLGIETAIEDDELNIATVKLKDRIVWIDPKDEAKTPHYGVVMFVGSVTGIDGIQLGVEFEDACGMENWTGKHSKKQYFTCKAGHGRFLPQDVPGSWLLQTEYERQKTELKTEVEPEAKMEAKDLPAVKELKEVKDDGAAAVSEAVVPETKPRFSTVKKCHGFSTGDRVLVKVKSDQKIGTVRWMGVIPDFLSIELAGVEMDELTGSPDDVTYCGFAGNAERGYLEVFNCKAGHGHFAVVKNMLPVSQEVLDDPSWTTVGQPKKQASSEAPRVSESLYVNRDGTSVPYPPQANGFSVPLQTQPVRPINLQPHGASSAPYSESPARQPLPQPLVPGFGHLDPQYVLSLGQKAFTFFGETMVTGTVKWIGVPHFNLGVHVGLLLHQEINGTPGGTIDGIDYFDALMGFGVVIPLECVHPLQVNPSLGSAPPVSGFGPVRPPTRQHQPTRPLHHSRPPIQQMFQAQTAPPQEPIGPPEHVLKALEQADKQEKSLNDRKDHVAVFKFLAEDQGAFDVTVDEKDGTKGFVKFLLRPPPDSELYCITRITMPDVVNGTADAEVVPKRAVKDIEFFPPFFLHFDLIEGFPNQTPPLYNVQCNWMTDTQVNKLRKHIFEVWRETVGQPGEKNILWESIGTLKSSLLRLVGLEFGIIYVSQAVDSFDTTASDSPCGKCVYKTDKEVMDVFSRMAKFNDKQCQERDELEKVECPNCLEEVSPTQISFFSRDCRHAELFCKECITKQVRAQVEANNTTEIKCLAAGCPVLSSHIELADLINPNVFEAMSPQVNDRLINEMPDIRRCPACNHAVIFEDAMIGNDRYITCPIETCATQYCPNCRGKSHGDEPCLSFDKKRELRERFANAASQAEKDALIKEFGQDNINHAILDGQSEEYIKTHGKPCPQCKSPTEKIEGCNKMTCTRCHTYFCYLCGVELSKTQPYSHFGAGCAQFDGR